MAKGEKIKLRGGGEENINSRVRALSRKRSLAKGRTMTCLGGRWARKGGKS